MFEKLSSVLRFNYSKAFYKLFSRFFDNYPISKRLDAEINSILDGVESGDNIFYHVVLFDSPRSKDKVFSIVVKNRKIWISNFPYAFGRNVTDGLKQGNYVPSVDTRWRLKEALENNPVIKLSFGVRGKESEDLIMLKFKNQGFYE